MTSTDLARAVVTALARGRGDRGRAWPRVRATRRCPSRRTTRRRPACSGSTPASTSAPRASSRSGSARCGARAAVVCTSGTAVANLHPADARGGARRRADGRGHRRPTRAAPWHERQPDHGTGRCLRLAGAGRRRGRGRAAARRRRRAAAHERPARRAAGAGRPVGAGPRAPGRSRRVDQARAGAPRPRSAHGRGRGRRRGLGGPRARARTAGWPLLAEPSSGARNGANAVRCYRLLLDGDLGRQVERVVVAGHPTLSRPVTRLLSREGVEVVDMSAGGLTRPFAVDAEVVEPRVGRHRRPGLAHRLAVGRRVGVRPARRAARRRGRPHAVRRRRRGQPRRPGRRAVVRRRLEPGPRPRPDGAAVPRRRTPQGDREPGPVRHRRDRVDGDRRRPGSAHTARTTSR